MGRPLNIGIIGAGTISRRYARTIADRPELHLTAVADLVEDRATELAAAYPPATARSVGELLSSDDVDVVVNLTIPAAHTGVSMAALRAGKHVYVEKPLALDVAEAGAVLDFAEGRGLRVACAPDTVLGTGFQTARHLLDAGAVGDAVAATAFWTSPGHETWHHDPAFYYQPGAGPLLDMGPYYLTALISLLGPVEQVFGAGSRAADTRTVGSGPRQGQRVPVEVDTHVSALLRHESGLVSTLMVSFDVAASRLPRIEVYGTAGTLSVPDPNAFDGTCDLWRPGSDGWVEQQPLAGAPDTERGYGLVDLADALAHDREHRASGRLALHVLDVMRSVLTSNETRSGVRVGSTCSRPPALPLPTSAGGGLVGTA
ncbi:Gfo/Idh/MocA family protein [Actinoalloteichus spitiensis]|uniref:Gfo/Idh/MocA family protein n=1 Tax=Actinoalloteichus spitiensis TaxID=252394 RepID=UPI000365D803|nr:Gfo/Idh/MocA family oxidoreductase [Actinoalloteichus spitiensis]